MKRLLLFLVMATVVSSAVVADEVVRYDENDRPYYVEDRPGLVEGTVGGVARTVDNAGRSIGHGLHHMFGGHHRSGYHRSRYCDRHPNAPECH